MSTSGPASPAGLIDADASPEEVVVAYHEWTKHHFHRYAACPATWTQASLQQALRTLRAIRQRYEIDRSRNSSTRFLSIQVALGYADKCWITAAIEAVEKAIVS